MIDQFVLSLQGIVGMIWNLLVQYFGISGAVGIVIGVYLAKAGGAVLGSLKFFLIIGIILILAAAFIISIFLPSMLEGLLPAFLIFR